MAQKIVSYNVAKALKEAGYPQAKNDLYYNENGTVRCCSPHTFTVTYACPTYLDVWLWLWREKGIRFDIEDLWDAELSYPERGCASNTSQLGGICTPEVSDPEEAIAKVIDYLVENKLLK